MKRIRSKTIVFLGGVMLVGVAYVLGTQAAGLLNKWDMGRNAEHYRSKAVEQTAAILRKMGTIKIGDTLSNFAFEDIDGELHLLNEILTDRTLIIYMKPDCDGCLVELERLGSAADGPEDYKRVLIISSANPLHLQRLRDDYGLGCLILYDEERLFGSALQIMSYPFNLVVDRDRVIMEIHGNILLADDYKRLFSVVTSARRMSTCAAFGAPPLAAGTVAGCRSVFRRSHARAEKPDTRQMWTSAGHVTDQRPTSHPEPVEGWLTVAHPTGGFHSGSRLPPTRRCTLGGVQAVIPEFPYVIPEQSGIHVRRTSLKPDIFAVSQITDRDVVFKNTTPPLAAYEWTWTPACAGVTHRRPGVTDKRLGVTGGCAT